MKDKYDEAIEYLTKYPEEIAHAWSGGHTAECLFDLAGRSSDGDYGCLTMIRGCDKWEAETPELTQQIRDDHRIPKWGHSITVADLPVFAEWQRRLDRELNRTKS